MRAVDHSLGRGRPIPLTVVDGFSGAAKSAVVRHSLLSVTDRRIAAVVRDLAPFLTDGAGDVQRDGPVAVWPNGSMAIATDDPTATVAVLGRREQPPEHVLVEADGAANPRRLSGYG